MEIEGKVLQLLPIQNISTQKGPMKKLEFILEVESKFPKKVCFSLWNEKVDNFPAKPGETVKVSFDLESREYNGKWYTDAKAWKVEKPSAYTQDDIDNHIPPEINEDIPTSYSAKKEEMDDLPF